MKAESVLEIVDQGAWNGGTTVDNTMFEKMGLVFKGGIPVNSKTIEERMGVRKRIAAPADARIGRIAFQNLLEKSNIDASRIKVLIGATNVGDDKYEQNPQIGHAYELVRHLGKDNVAFDLYAGCPGFNVSVELIFMLSLSGILQKSDISIVIGAENLHRAKAFRSDDTANIIFGDDALATALETKSNRNPIGHGYGSDKARLAFTENFVTDVARKLFEMNGYGKLDGIIIDNQFGKIEYKVPATAARVQHHLIELMYPEALEAGEFKKFMNALSFYDLKMNTFAFDIMSLSREPNIVELIARAYVESGKYKTVASIFLAPDQDIEMTIHKGSGYMFQKPDFGIVDTLTRTHGCFGDFIQTVFVDGDVFGEMDGKGVFLYATRSAKKQFTDILAANHLTFDDIELLIEHQANFAMIPMTLEKILEDKQAVSDVVADRMVMNIHERGNCSVVCMQRLPYDLQRGSLKEDTVQEFSVNRNVEKLRDASLVMYDSVGAGMTRSSFLLKK